MVVVVVAAAAAVVVAATPALRARHEGRAAAAVFVHLALRWGRNWAAQWNLARAVGKRFRGCRA